MQVQETQDTVTEPFMDQKDRPSSQTQPHLGWYFLCLFFIPVLVCVLSYVAVVVPAMRFDRWGQSKWGPLLQYGYTVQDANADVVVFGDSSAFLGVDPRQVNAALGIHSLVIPDTLSSIPVTGDAPLRAYLQHNRAPRLLVLYVTAWDLDALHMRNQHSWYEGEEMLLRYGTARQILDFTARHPMEMLLFPLRLNSTLGVANLKASLRTDRAVSLAQDLGHADYTDPFPPLSEGCALEPDQAAPTPDTWVRELRQQYSTPQTTVAVYLAPLPACSNAGSVTARSYADIQAAAPVALPPSWFARDGLNAHILPNHVHDSTALFTRFVQSHLPQ